MLCLSMGFKDLEIYVLHLIYKALYEMNLIVYPLNFR